MYTPRSGWCFHLWLWSANQQCCSCIVKVTPLVATRHSCPRHKKDARSTWISSPFGLRLFAVLHMIRWYWWASWCQVGLNTAISYLLSKTILKPVALHSFQGHIDLLNVTKRTVAGRSEGCSYRNGKSSLCEWHHSFLIHRIRTLSISCLRHLLCIAPQRPCLLLLACFDWDPWKQRQCHGGFWSDSTDLINPISLELGPIWTTSLSMTNEAKTSSGCI